jgi:hypothetical protein
MGLGTDQSTLELTGTTKDKTASARIALWSNAGTTLALHASGPLNKADGTAVFADLDGIRRSNKVGIGWRTVFWEPQMLSTQGGATDLQAICERLKIAMNSGNCRVSYLRDRHPTLVAAANRAVDLGHPLTLGASLEIGSEGFTYLDTETGAEVKTDRSPLAVKVGAQQLISPRVALSGLYRLERTFKSGSATEVCRPIAAPEGATRCDAAVIGGPSEKERSVVTGELRWFQNG